MVVTHARSAPALFWLGAMFLTLFGAAPVVGAETREAAEGAFSHRVERVIEDNAERQALPASVRCRDQAGQGPWLLVSRAWGGSVHLRRMSLVPSPAEGAALAVPTRVWIPSGACGVAAVTRR